MSHLRNGDNLIFEGSQTNHQERGEDYTDPGAGEVQAVTMKGSSRRENSIFLDKLNLRGRNHW